MWGEYELAADGAADAGMSASVSMVGHTARGGRYYSDRLLLAQHMFLSALPLETRILLYNGGACA